MFNKVTIAVWVGALTLLTGCASLKTDSWSDPSVKERSLGKVMVLATFERETTTRFYEEYFVGKLSEKGIDASAGHSIITTADEITREMVDAALSEGKYDSIILTRLMGEDSQNQIVYAGYTSSPYFSDYYGGYGGFSGGSVLTATSYADAFMEYHVETLLFDVNNNKMIWGGSKTVTDIHSQSSNIRDVVSSVMRDLKRKKML